MWLLSQALCVGEWVSVLPRERTRRKHLCTSDFVVLSILLMGRAVGVSLCHRRQTGHCNSRRCMEPSMPQGRVLAGIKS